MPTVPAKSVVDAGFDHRDVSAGGKRIAREDHRVPAPATKAEIVDLNLAGPIGSKCILQPTTNQPTAVGIGCTDGGPGGQVGDARGVADPTAATLDINQRSVSSREAHPAGDGRNPIRLGRCLERTHGWNEHPVPRGEAFLIAVNITKLPSVPRQILKDISRPPNRPPGMIEQTVVCGVWNGQRGLFLPSELDPELGLVKPNDFA